MMNNIALETQPRKSGDELFHEDNCEDEISHGRDSLLCNHDNKKA